MYAGPNRRHHRMFVTQNTEYHLRDDRCVAVRERPTGRWLDEHPALGKQLEGGVRFNEAGGMQIHAAPPSPGDVMFFAGPSRTSLCDSVLTSKVIDIDRPPREAVSFYLS